MSELREQLLAAAAALSFPNSHNFAWFGKEPAQLPPALRRSIDPATIVAHLTNMLTEQLYRHFYCAGYARPVRWLAQGAGTASNDLAEPFLAACGNRDRWQSGWSVCGRDGDLVRIRRDGLTVSVREDAIRPTLNHEIEIGVPVERRASAALLRWSQGFLVAIGDDPLSDNLIETVRFYWNLTPAGAIGFARSATSALNKAGLPFQLKILADPHSYNRCDAGVLYLRREDLRRAGKTIERLHDALRSELKPATPIFTRQLGRGLAFAESPAGGMSFGQHRCGLMAQGLVEAQQAGIVAPEARVEAIFAAFARVGIESDRTYLNSATDENRLVPPELARHPSIVLAGSSAAAEPIAPERAVETIADSLCETAMWHNGQCNWLTPVEATGGFSNLAAGLYEGLAGVALFLAEAGRHCGNRNYTRTALGALQTALQDRRLVEAPCDASLYSGEAGLALACLHIARATGDRTAAAACDRLVSQILVADLAHTGNDLLSGWAGIICAALELHAVTGDRRLLDFADAAGETLLAERVQSRTGTSWRTINKVGEYNLTGFSHGTAGIAHGLLRLYSATRNPRLLEAAESAIGHEQNWFDPAQGNWPDLRESTASRKAKATNRDFSTYWCHGAPGIALARISALRATGGSSYLHQARAALHTTLRGTSEFAIDNPAGLCLCHGLAGNADILLSAARILGDPSLIDEQLTRRVLTGIGMVCQALENERPAVGVLPHQFRGVGLMTGLAGLGWHCLRSIDGTMPSVLNCFAADRPLDLGVTGLDGGGAAGGEPASFALMP